MNGLQNLGDTCYLNSILQILANTSEFRDMLLSITETHSTGVGLDVLKHFRLFVEKYHTETGIELNSVLRTFISVFQQCNQQFGMGQHDQHECLMFLFRIIHDNCNVRRKYLITGTPTSRGDELELESLESMRVHGSSTTDHNLSGTEEICYDSPIFHLFTGQYRFQTECRNPECHHVSNRFETFRGLEVPIGKKGNTTLTDALDELVSITKIEDGETYECDKCGQKTQSFRRCTLWRLPKILVITLKRNIYRFVGGRPISYKDDRPVEVPETLDVTPYLSVPRDVQPYELYATGNHLGTPNGGHCYTHIKIGDKWILANDHILSQQSRTDDRHKYVLFYRQPS